MSESKYKRWMVGLDLTDIDIKVVNRVSYLSKILDPLVIHFIHVDKEHEIPKYLPDDIKKSIEVDHKEQAQQMQKCIDENFDNPNVDIRIEVVSGKPFDTLITWAKSVMIDFFIAGRKEKSEGSGMFPHRLLRRLICPVLFVPDMKMPGTKRILVPVDFSDHSFLALKTAIKLVESNDEIEMDCLHIYNVPTGYYKTGKTYEEFAHIMKNNAIAQFQKFVRPLKTTLYLNCLPLEDGTAAELIYNESESGNYDLIVMGSKGQSVGSVILLGSTAEKLVQLNHLCMTWIVKKPDEHIGFFEALKKI